MTIIGDLLLTNLLAYLINLASGERSAAIAAAREAKLRDVLEHDESLRKALASTHSVRDEVSGVCAEFARNRATLGVPAHEEPLWQLLSDAVFQADLVEWLMAGAIEEGNAAKGRILDAMELAVSECDATPEQIAFLKSGYFDALEKTIYANPILARWRHQLSLDYLREQVTVLRRHAEEAAGVFSPEKQKATIERYCEKALAAWDIIDLSNLPEGDIHMATQTPLLRQLYMPLRIEVEPTRQGEGDEAVLARMEEEREARRKREAGHFLMDESHDLADKKTRVPVGERLAASNRLVVLGDPGGGKTTMLRWMATAYLLRHKNDAAFSQVPDTQTLPAKPWIPVLIRCRDLGEQDLCRCFTDFLTQHLNKTELLPDEADVMCAVILDRIAIGEALLLVDGLDEITNPNVRMMFCQELERTAARYPEAPIVVTSRIVGYRDMPYRMGSGFEHGQIAELSREDKDLFASRWVDVTEQHQSIDEKARRAQELLDALHSSDRIERLTGNPMLLTTLALVKRKVGKLPNKRTKLYAEAVSVLLNWNPRLYQTIEEDEAIPQLEYLAYEMCRRGVQRLSDDDVLELLDKLRVEYPNIRAIRRRDPADFLKHLEERSSILIRSGGIWQKNAKHEKPVWEFRHLTFQEYLAARALLDGRYPGRDKTKTLAGQVAPLAGAVPKSNSGRPVPSAAGDAEVPESWREALRLLVADCKDDDVDDVLLSILTPLEGEDEGAVRPRAVLASLCLADEPNVSPEVAVTTLATFAKCVDYTEGLGSVETSLERAAIEIAGSMWAGQLKKLLIEEFMHRPFDKRENPGGLWAMAEVELWRRSATSPEIFVTELVKRIQCGGEVDCIAAVLTIMELAFEDKVVMVGGLIDALISCLSVSRPKFHAAAWALWWLSGAYEGGPRAIWSPDQGVIPSLAHAVHTADLEEKFGRRIIVETLGHSEHSVLPLLTMINDSDPEVRLAVINALGKLGDKRAVAPLLTAIADPNEDVRLAVIRGLGKLGDKQAVAPLLASMVEADTNILLAIIEALGGLGDKAAVAPLLTKLTDKDQRLSVAAAAALHALGEPSHLARLLNAEDSQVRQSAIRAYSRYKQKLDQRLLSRDLDGASPWLDPRMAVANEQIYKAANRLNMSAEEVRSRFEALAGVLNLKLGWKP